MASAAPILLAAGAAALLLGKKKKKTYGEPGQAPGSGMGDEDEAIDLILQAQPITPKQQMILTSVAANTQPSAPETQPARMQKEQEDVKPSGSCKIGQISSDKKYVCWGSPGAKDKNMKVAMRRVAPYKEAKNTALAVALGTISGGGVILTQSPRIQFAVFCWLNRSKLYRCTSRYKIGKKRCKPGKWERY